MLIGHLPAGYLLSSALRDRWHGVSESHAAIVFAAGLVGSMFPDIDWLYVWFMVEGDAFHHQYWTHLPVFWASVIPVLLMLAYLSRATLVFRCVAMFGAGVVLHLLLDSIVGNIWWLYPWVDKPYSLFTVKFVYDPWWINFLIHWSFGLELILTAWAVWEWRRRASIRVAGQSGG